MVDSQIPPEPGPSSRSVKTLARGLEILELFSADASELSQSDIAALCGLPMPTVHRLVGTLVAHKFLEPVAAGRNLRLGAAVMRLCGNLEGRRDPSQVARRKLNQLSEVSGETANLATLVGSLVVYLDGALGTRVLTPKTAIGARLTAHNTALGKALLAQLDDSEVRRRLGPEPYAKSTEYTAATWAELKSRLDVVREQGISISDEEYEIGLTSLAISLPPLPDGSMRAINISLPITRATPEFRLEAFALLRSAAAGIVDGDCIC